MLERQLKQVRGAVGKLEGVLGVLGDLVRSLTVRPIRAQERGVGPRGRAPIFFSHFRTGTAPKHQTIVCTLRIPERPALCADRISLT